MTLKIGLQKILDDARHQFCIMQLFHYVAEKHPIAVTCIALWTFHL